MPPTPPWQPAPLTLACSDDCRSQACLRRVLEQFSVGENQRYAANQMGLGETYCNIFVWDATRALECEIPHWCGDHGEALPVGRGRELSAAGMIGWLRVYGSDHGWREMTLSEAVGYADLGRPVVLAWENPDHRKPSHVAMLLPRGPDGVVRIAQAGMRNFFAEPIAHGFGSLKPTAWAHD